MQTWALLTLCKPEKRKKIRLKSEPNGGKNKTYDGAKHLGIQKYDEELHIERLGLSCL